VPAGWLSLYKVRVGGTPCLTAAGASGDDIDKAEAISWGQCPTSVAATSVSSGQAPLTHGVPHKLGNTALAPQQPGSTANSHQKATPK
jgi:hypothetical protein